MIQLYSHMLSNKKNTWHASNETRQGSVQAGLSLVRHFSFLSILRPDECNRTIEDHSSGSVSVASNTSQFDMVTDKLTTTRYGRKEHPSIILRINEQSFDVSLAHDDISNSRRSSFPGRRKFIGVKSIISIVLI